LAASFIFSQTCDVRYGHIAAFQTHAPNGRYWTNNGQRMVRALNCWAAIDPKRTNGEVRCPGWYNSISNSNSDPLIYIIAHSEFR
jgi:hypothetical protein